MNLDPNPLRLGLFLVSDGSLFVRDSGGIDILYKILYNALHSSGLRVSAGFGSVSFLEG